ncbi:low-affinity methionine permease [[Candida] anglica]|uniref:Low-affinity methionine permease n=1 Tax=[Candida] anglica TaxID=148631 RepID=A0ABP0EAM0_9ASCO
MSPTLIPSISTESAAYSQLPREEKRRYHKLSSLSCMALIVNKMIGTGIFSTPAIIFQYCGGNVPLYLSLWLIGGVIVLSGLLIFLEFALNLPFRNGGEKNYLLRAFPNPKGLAGCVYAFQMVLLGFSSGNSFAFGKYFLYAFGYNVDGQDEEDWRVKLVGVACISGCVWVHMKWPNQGTKLFNFLGIFKIGILVLIILLGAIKLVTGTEPGSVSNSVSSSVSSNSNSISSSSSSYSIAIALLEIIYSFKGWENANYVLSEVSNPYRVLTIIAPLSVLVTVILYFLVIVSYLVVIPHQELMDSGVLVAGVFFTKIFGESLTSKILPIFISLSNLGNVLVVSFAHGHVNQELARSNYLPFSHYFTNLNHALLLHWFITVLVLVAPPSSAIYEFVVNLYIYPGTWINVGLTIGLLYLKWNSQSLQWGAYSQVVHNERLTATETTELLEEENESYTDFDTSFGSIAPPPGEEIPPPILPSTFSVPYPFIFIFLLANVFLALFPFVKPPSGSPGALSPIPHWCFPTIGSGVLAAGAVWFYSRQRFHVWRHNKTGAGEPVVEYKEDIL